jgi:hypothetical protein
VRDRLALIAVLAGCYDPRLPLGVPCTTGDGCPNGQHCSNQTCVGDGSRDAGGDAGPVDTANPIDTSGAPIVVLDEEFNGTALPAGWQVVPSAGTWTVSGGMAVAGSPGPEADYLTYRLPSDGTYRVTVTLTVDRMLGATAADHYVGVALQTSSTTAGDLAGAVCALSKQQGQEGLLLFDLSDSSGQADLGFRGFTLAVGTVYTLTVARVATDVDMFSCSSHPPMVDDMISAASTVPIAAPPYLSLLASGIAVRIDSVKVERLP